MRDQLPTEISRQEAIEHLQRCEVDTLTRLHSGLTVLDLRDGRRLKVEGVEFELLRETPELTQHCPEAVSLITE